MFGEDTLRYSLLPGASEPKVYERGSRLRILAVPSIWLVVNIMVPFWILNIRHLIFMGPKKGQPPIYTIPTYLRIEVLALINPERSTTLRTVSGRHTLSTKVVHHEGTPPLDLNASEPLGTAALTGRVGGRAKRAPQASEAKCRHSSTT